MWRGSRSGATEAPIARVRPVNMVSAASEALTPPRPSIHDLDETKDDEVDEVDDLMMFTRVQAGAAVASPVVVELAPMGTTISI